MREGIMQDSGLNTPLPFCSRPGITTTTLNKKDIDQLSVYATANLQIVGILKH